MLVLGGREEEADSVAVRHRKHGDLGIKKTDEFVAELLQLIESKSTAD